MLTARKKLSREAVTAFRRTVLNHFKKHGRDLPWRNTADPYAIAVSEVMLQQTQVPRVIAKYREFMRLFPTVHKLAKAPLSDVLRAWSGLGYNRRARYVHQMAQQVVEMRNGIFPHTQAELEKLPAIGRYTAGAVMAFAYNHPAIFIETNIRTVYLHHFFPGQTTVADKDLLPLIEQTLDAKNSRRWYAALMDYGSCLKQEGNTAHRKSRHYVRQSPFAGSHRQVRGIIIKSLLEGPKTIAALTRETEKPKSLVTLIVQALVQERMLEKQGTRYALAGS
jgi:A/G-specific adenine glycosylase